MSSLITATLLSPKVNPEGHTIQQIAGITEIGVIASGNFIDTLLLNSLLVYLLYSFDIIYLSGWTNWDII
jgi:hypothetical protein